MELTPNNVVRYGALSSWRAGTTRNATLQMLWQVEDDVTSKRASQNLNSESMVLVRVCAIATPPKMSHAKRLGACNIKSTLRAERQALKREPRFI